MQSIRNNNNFFLCIVNGSDIFVIHFHIINDIKKNNINVFELFNDTHVDLVYHEILHQLTRLGRLGSVVKPWVLILSL